MTSSSVTAVHSKRPLQYVFLSLLLFAAAGSLAYDVWRHPAETSAPSVYDYTVKQSMDNSIAYFKSSFYGDTPGQGNSAYVANLTDTVKTTLHYDYKASRTADLTSFYSAVAKVSAKYATGTDGKTVATVWSKEYPILKPTSETKTTDQISLHPEATLPFAEYRKDMDQFKTSLAVPVTLEAQLIFVVRTYGTVDGTNLDDVRTSSVTVPLDQPLFTPENKFEKDTTKHVTTKAAKDTEDKLRVYERIAAGVLALLGMMSFVYGMRRQIFKSPHQRQLDRIYRLHDGIIVRTKHPVDVSDSKIVALRSFDDMLNLEEELKVPIVANEISSTTTEFMIVNSGVVYRYTLSDDSSSRSSAVRGMTKEALKAPREAPVHRERVVDTPVRPHVRKSIRVDEPSLEDIVEELAHHPRSSKKK